MPSVSPNGLGWESCCVVVTLTYVACCRDRDLAELLLRACPSNFTMAILVFCFMTPASLELLVLFLEVGGERCEVVMFQDPKPLVSPYVPQVSRLNPPVHMMRIMDRSTL